MELRSSGSELCFGTPLKEFGSPLCMEGNCSGELQEQSSDLPVFYTGSPHFFDHYDSNERGGLATSPQAIAVLDVAASNTPC